MLAEYGDECTLSISSFGFENTTFQFISKTIIDSTSFIVFAKFIIFA